MNEFNDFLGELGGAYASYVDSQKSDDMAKQQQAAAAAAAASAQKEMVISDRAKQLLIYGTIALLVIGIVFAFLKKK